MRLRKSEAVALLGEVCRRVPAQVNPHIVVVIGGRRVVDGDAGIVRNRSKVLIILVLVHLGQVRLFCEHVPSGERRAHLGFGIRLHNRSIPLVAIVWIVEAGGRPLVATCVSHPELPLHQLSCTRQLVCRNLSLVSMAPIHRIEIVGIHVNSNFIFRAGQTCTIDECYGGNLILIPESRSFGRAHHRIEREGNFVGFARFRRRSNPRKFVCTVVLGSNDLFTLLVYRPVLVERSRIRANASQAVRLCVRLTARRRRAKPSFRCQTFFNLSNNN